MTSVCSLSSKHMSSCPESGRYICTPCTVCESPSNNRLKKSQRSACSVATPWGSHLVLCSSDICSITIMLLSPYVCPRAIQTWTRRMWTASNFLFERLWILVLRSPTAHRNHANTRAKQFVFYLQVHLRLCTGHPNQSLFISSSANLLRKASKLTLSPVLGDGEGSHLYSSTQKSISILTDGFWGAPMTVVSHIFFGSV